jgi:hypothetical protein
MSGKAASLFPIPMHGAVSDPSPSRPRVTETCVSLRQEARFYEYLYSVLAMERMQAEPKRILWEVSRPSSPA